MMCGVCVCVCVFFFFVISTHKWNRVRDSLHWIDAEWGFFKAFYAVMYLKKVLPYDWQTENHY